MANWSTTTKHEPSSINNGRRYELRDRVSIEQLNNMTENSFYAMEASSVAKEKAEQALEHAVSGGSRVLENGQFVAEFNADKKVDTTTLEENYYNKQQVDDLLASGSVDVDLSDYYKKSETYSRQEIDDKLANLDVDIDFSNYYTKPQTDSLLSGKADKSSLNATNTTISTIQTKLDGIEAGAEVNRVESVNGKIGAVVLSSTDVGALPNTTKYGASLDLSINTTDYKVTAQLKDQNGNNLGDAKTIDLPLESVVVSGRYDDATKKVVLTLQNDTEISFSVADLVSGLQSQITLSNKLASDLVSDTNQTNKFVTAAEKSTWNNKVDVGVDNLTNYYKKSETYTKTETQNLLNAGLETKANKTDLNAYATKEELGSYATKDEVLTEEDLKDYATDSEVQGWISSESSSLREDINKKADASALEGLEDSINQVSNNLTGISQQYVQDAAVSPDGKTLQIVKKVGNEIKNVYFQGGGGLTFDDIYPVGSIYLTTETSTTGTVSPASLFGGTWERLPEGYALWTASSGAGETISAGLPNITGSFQGNQEYSGNWNAWGVFSLIANSEAGYTGSSAQSRTRLQINFDASKKGADAIYGKSTTVQPPAYKVYVWKRIS